MKKKSLFWVLLFMVSVLMIPNCVSAAGLDLSAYTSESLSDAFADEAITDVDFGSYSDEGDKVVIYLFRGEGCLNCINFLNYVKNTLIPKYGEQFKIVSYKFADKVEDRLVSNSYINLLDKTLTFLNQKPSNNVYPTPYIVIGDKTFSEAIDSAKKSQIEAMIQSNTRYNVLEEMEKGTSNVNDNKIFTAEGITFTTNSALSSNHTLKVLPIDAKDIKLGDFNYIAAYDITMCNEATIVPMSNGSFEIRIPVSTRYDMYKVGYINNGNVVEEIDATYDNGYVVFTTTHLSKYAVYGKNKSINASEVSQVEKEKNPETLDNVEIYGIMLILGCITLIGSTVFYRKKRRI